jgi:hypothetical protein
MVPTSILTLESISPESHEAQGSSAAGPCGFVERTLVSPAERENGHAAVRFVYEAVLDYAVSPSEHACVSRDFILCLPCGQAQPRIGAAPSRQRT